MKILRQTLAFFRENWMGVFLLIWIIAWAVIAFVSGGCPMCAVADWLE